MRKPSAFTKSGNSVVVAMLVTFVVTVLIAISANYTQQMSRIATRSRAIELYREITTHETDPKHIAEAQKRLTELSQKKY